MNYYNEIDPFAAAWLEALIESGQIPIGVVDRRSISEVKSNDLSGYTQCHFFAGIGGWSLALDLAGWPADRPVWTGSCPCQPFSTAGAKAGNEDARNLWSDFYRLISQRGPDVIFGEQVEAAIPYGWLDQVASDLEASHYAFGAAIVGAHSAGAPHRRQRIYWAADSERNEQSRQEPCVRTSGRMGRICESPSWDEPWESALSRFRALGDGLPRLVAATDGARNAIVPQVAAEFIKAFLSL